MGRLNLPSKISKKIYTSSAKLKKELKKESYSENVSKTKKEIEKVEIPYPNKNKKNKIVFTNGCFDVLHLGHVLYLEKAKSLGDFLVVGLNSDESVKRLKGTSRPVNTWLARAVVLAGLEAIDFVVLFEEDTPEKLIELLKPDIHCKGGDYKKEDLPEYSIVKSYNGEVKILAFSEGYSTTKLLKKLSK